jgi:hyperosmotically inducible protein
MLHYHGELKEGAHVDLRSQPERRSLCANQDVTADMRYAPYIKSRLLIVAAFALPSATASGQIATDDAALAARVKQALGADPELRSLPLSVATYRGVVQLSGYMDSDAQIQKALAVTRAVPGVQSVSNELQLRSQ